MRAKLQNPDVDKFIQDCERVNGRELAALKSTLLGLIERSQDAFLARAKFLGIVIPELGVKKMMPMSRCQLEWARVQLRTIHGCLRAGLEKRQPQFSPEVLGVVLMDYSPLLTQLPLSFLSSVARGRMNRPASMTPQQYQKKIGEKIAEARAAKKLSRQELAEAIGMTVVSIGRLETGKQRIGSTLLYVIADALNVDLQELLPIKVEPPDPLTLQEIDLVKAELLERVRALDEQRSRLRRKATG
jgi:transcriptional regulator with XRE-family HTH domain